MKNINIYPFFSTQDNHTDWCISANSKCDLTWADVMEAIDCPGVVPLKPSKVKKCCFDGLQYDELLGLINTLKKISNVNGHISTDYGMVTINVDQVKFYFNYTIERCYEDGLYGLRIESNIHPQGIKDLLYTLVMQSDELCQTQSWNFYVSSDIVFMYSIIKYSN